MGSNCPCQSGHNLSGGGGGGGNSVSFGQNIIQVPFRLNTIHIE